MKYFKLISILTLLFIGNNLFAQSINPQEVKKEMKRVADWTNGALYIGMLKWAELSDDESYYNWLKDIADQQEWKLHVRQYHADDHTIGQLYCNLYRKYKEESMIEKTRKQFDFIMYHPSQSVLNWKSPFHQDRWNWCDALFMSPPVWAQLYNITKEKKYLDFMLSEFKATTQFLFDKKENLYYRDGSYIGNLDKGTKIFWARGNGWVFAGLVNILNELNPKTKEYKYFLSIYKKMAKRLLEIQTSNGHWAMSLLGDKYYPTPETSGSSFFTYGLAWGINQGILDYETYEPSVRKAWNMLCECITEDGMLGYVQPIGAKPGKAWPNKTEVYGTGAFLSAGSEVYKLYEK